MLINGKEFKRERGGVQKGDILYEYRIYNAVKQKNNYPIFTQELQSLSFL
jgi:hypothetical protein